MGFWRRIFGGGVTEDRAGGGIELPLSQVLPSMLNLSTADSGITVTPEIALQADAVFACINVIASSVAIPPVEVVERDGSKRYDDHAICRLLNGGEPNPEMTSVTFRETVMICALLWGGGFAYIERDAAGRPAALWPLPGNTSLGRANGGSGELVYRVVLGGSYFELRPDQVLHILDLSQDGRVGMSRVSYGVNAIALALAAERFGSKFFSGGGNVGGILELPPGMKPDAVKEFVRTWKANYTGIENSLKTAVLTDGMKYQRIGVEPEKTQMIETRTAQLRAIARIYRVPPHMVGDLERATFSNIEHQSLEFAQNTVKPWAVKWEQELKRKCLLESEKPRLVVCFDLDSIQQVDTKTRYESYQIARQGGWLTVNDIRRKEKLPPVEGGDTLLSPLNMAPVGQKAGQAPEEDNPNDKAPTEKPTTAA